MDAASPSAPSEIVGRVLRGSRKMALDTKVNVNENGLEDMDDFWNTAKTPKAREPKNKHKKRQPLKQENRISIQRSVKRAPRFSLDGNTDGGSSVGGDIDEFRLKLEKGAISPGDLSHVTTAPPTPKAPEQSRAQSPVRSPENTRAHISEDDDAVLANKRFSKSPLETVDTMPISPSAPDDDFQMEDDGDDLLPPPPPEDLEPEVENISSGDNDVEFPAGGDSVSSSRSAATIHEAVSGASNEIKTVIVDEENDEDIDGQGFEMNSPTISTSTDPSSVVVTKKKRGRPRKNEICETAKTPAVQKGRKKQRQVTLFSPPGYPVGNREMNPVPVSDYKESPEQGKRRSRRMHVKPLAYWKNERIVYGPHDEDGELGDEMGCMPVPMSVLTALPTPRKQRKPVAFAGGSKKGIHSHENAVVVEEKPFDDSRLRKKYKFVDGEYAQIWDEALEASTDDKVVSYAENLVDTQLPLPKAGRKKSEGKVVGRAAQSFNVASSDNNVFVGYLMGNLKLPPKGIKDPESTGACSQVFTVCSCQPKSFEVAYGDPHEDEGSLSSETAQRFLLSAGDQFRIPPGNAYRLANHSSTTDCLLAWTIIRPPKLAESP